MHTDFTDWTDLRTKKNDLKIRNVQTILLHAYTLKRLTLKFSLRYQNFVTLKREILRGKYSNIVVGIKIFDTLLFNNLTPISVQPGSNFRVNFTQHKRIMQIIE